jgi:hypothetical protein
MFLSYYVATILTLTNSPSSTIALRAFVYESEMFVIGTRPESLPGRLTNKCVALTDLIIPITSISLTRL